MSEHWRTRRRRRRDLPLRLVALAGMRVVRAVRQASAIGLIKRQYPGIDFNRVKWPILEDLLNQQAFVLFRDWVHERGFAADGPLGPAVQGGGTGAGGKKLALPPVVPFNSEPEAHFEAAILNNPLHPKHEVIPSGVFMPGKDGTPVTSTSELQGLVRLLCREHGRLPIGMPAGLLYPFGTSLMVSQGAVVLMTTLRCYPLSFLGQVLLLTSVVYCGMFLVLVAYTVAAAAQPKY